MGEPNKRKRRKVTELMDDRELDLGGVMEEQEISDEMILARDLRDFNPTPRTMSPTVNTEWTDRLMLDGEPIVYKISDNTQQFGFPSPRLAYIMSETKPTIVSVAKKWRVPEQTIARWYNQSNWASQREEYWLRIETKQYQMAGAGLAERRGRILARQGEIWEEIQAVVMGHLRNGKKTLMIRGVLEEVPLTPDDLLKITASMEKATTNELLTVGLTAISARNAEVDMDDDNRPVVNMTLNFTKRPEQVAEERMKAIEQEKNTVEGEIVDGEK